MSRARRVVVLASLGLATLFGAQRAFAPGLAMPGARDHGFPRSDAACAADTAKVGERRVENSAANAAEPSGPVSWPAVPEMDRWNKWTAKRAKVTGRYAGTTDQILNWAACKWGVDGDLLRAVAVQESDWRQDKIGDDGHSFGIMQIKNSYANGSPAWGGYPDTYADTALNVDFYAAYLRSCVDGDFYDGGQWLYGGRRLSQLIAARGADYVTWGCVGSWYSGDWYDPQARDYILRVQERLATRAWEHYPIA
jgi:hypothetical protein